MSHDPEQATERSRLLLHVPNDRRFSAIQHEGDVHSVFSSHLSKEEQALSSTPIGERLPYNDYTTIDWLHDLVGLRCLVCKMLGSPYLDDDGRSKTPFDYAPFALAVKVCEQDSCRPSTRVRDGLLRLSLAS